MSDIKTYINDTLSDITIGDELSNKILDQTIHKNDRKHYRFTVRRTLAYAVVFCLVLTGTMTAFAATVPSFNEWIYKMSPEFAEFLYPINKSAEDNGIRVEVLAAVNDDHNAAVYFTVQDMAGKGRVDEKLDLCDSYYIDGPCNFNVQMLSYDKETNTAFFVMRGSGADGMSGQITNFEINRLMSDKTEYDWFDTGIDLAGLIDGEENSLPMSEFNYTGGSEPSEEELSVLEPDVMSIPFGGGIDFVTISNIGFVNGKLHIQTKWETSFDNHGDLWLTDEKGVVNGVASTVRLGHFYFNTPEDTAKSNNGNFAKHIEYIFDVGSVEELSNYNLWANFVGDGVFTEGEWKVSFRLSDAEQLDIGETVGVADRVEVTSIGAYIDDYSGSVEEYNFSIVLKDGTDLNYSMSGSDDRDGGRNGIRDISMMFDTAIDIKDIARVSLDGVEIYKVQSQE